LPSQDWSEGLGAKNISSAGMRKIPAVDYIARRLRSYINGLSMTNPQIKK